MAIKLTLIIPNATSGRANPVAAITNPKAVNDIPTPPDHNKDGYFSYVPLDNIASVANIVAAIIKTPTAPIANAGIPMPLKAELGIKPEITDIPTPKANIVAAVFIVQDNEG